MALHPKPPPPPPPSDGLTYLNDVLTGKKSDKEKVKLLKKWIES